MATIRVKLVTVATTTIKVELDDERYGFTAPEILLERMQEDAVAKAQQAAPSVLSALSGLIVDLEPWRGADEPLDYRPVTFGEAVKEIKHGDG